MEIGRYQFIPKDIYAVQVTEENLEDVAKWCGGLAHYGEDPSLNPSISIIKDGEIEWALLGDWIYRYAQSSKFVVALEDEAFPQGYVKVNVVSESDLAASEPKDV